MCSTFNIKRATLGLLGMEQDDIVLRVDVGWWGLRITGRERRVKGTMLKIRSRGSESVEQMLKRFKKLCEKEGLTKEMKRNSYYEKPSERKRRQLRKSMRQTVRGKQQPETR